MSRGGRGPASKEEFQAAVRRLDEQLEQARAGIALIDERSQEYDDLDGLLRDLPEKLSHPVMVPYGPLACFEGRLVHTNEVLTQLSSEYFVSRTTKHALGLVERRQERLRRERQDVAKDVQEMEQRRRVAAGEGEAPAGPSASWKIDDDGFMDIREPCEDGLTNIRERCVDAPPPTPSAVPRSLAPPAPAAPAAVPAALGATPTATPAGAADGDTLSRLRELERLEAMEELDVLVESLEQRAESASGAEVSHVAAPTAPVARSPADLYQLMGQDTGAFADRASEVPAQLGAQTGTAAFSGQIGERAGIQAAPEGYPDAGEEAEPPKRVSKFKADRAARR